MDVDGVPEVPDPPVPGRQVAGVIGEEGRQTLPQKRGALGRVRQRQQPVHRLSAGAGDKIR